MLIPVCQLMRIDLCVIQWLEQSYWPEGMSEAKMEKLQLKIED